MANVVIYRLTDDGFQRLVDGSLTPRIIDEMSAGITLFKPNPLPGGDISKIWQPQNSYADYVMSGPVLQTGTDLETAFLNSVFSDREAAPDDVIPDGSNDPRGWHGDAGEPYPIGSRMWLLERSKLTADIPLRAKDYLAECLQWMLDDGVVSDVQIQTAVILPSMLGAAVQLYQQKGVALARNYAWVWQGIG